MWSVWYHSSLLAYSMGRIVYRFTMILSASEAGQAGGGKRRVVGGIPCRAKGTIRKETLWVAQNVASRSLHT
jgi:hypothetical protein